jgi:2-oxoglutarate ferredoxin oxidoreductase subunit gamma
LDDKIVEEVMLSMVPEKVKAENKKAYELGIKYAKKATA